MEELRTYVEKLFKKQGHSKETNELKEEIFSNLLAKRDDLIANGLDKTTATLRAKESIHNIEELMEGNIKIYIEQFKYELFQRIVIYLLSSWIIFGPIHFLTSRSTSLFTFVFGIFIIIPSLIYSFYYLLSHSKRKTTCWDNVDYISLPKLRNLRKLGWIGWGIFIIFTTIITTGINFSSNIWFQRKIVIDGPYQLAILVAAYIFPLVTIVIPLLLQGLLKLATKYEVTDNE
jgi:hypothetical protein